MAKRKRSQISESSLAPFEMESKRRSTTTEEELPPNLEDTITEDGILCSIISSLPLKQAVATCVISRRWKNIWNHLPKLKFDTANMFEANIVRLILPDDSPLTMEEKVELLQGMRSHFVQSVDTIIHQHQGHLDEILVRYFLDKNYSSHLDAWVRFAVTSKTKSFVFHLHKPGSIDVATNPYDFPCHMLKSSSIEKLSLSSCSLKSPCRFDVLNRLKELSLFYIDVTEEDMDRLLSNCYTLESLTLARSPRLVRLSIPNSLTKFRYLWVRDCVQLREIKIDAVNFSSLNYWGAPVDFTLRESTQLKYANVYFRTERNRHNLQFYLNKLSSNLRHLQSLVFLISGVPKVVDLPKASNRFIHLTCLEFSWSVRSKMSLLSLCTLVDIAPFMAELKLRLLFRVVEQPLPELSELRELLPNHPHNHLKTIEISGFYFDRWQIEIALYLLKNATALESMRIEKGLKPPMEISEKDKKNLIQEVPADVKLVIL